MMTKEHAAAIEALERGWSIIPINPENKRPLVDWLEYQDRFPTDEEVDQWWTQYPYAIPAVITGWRSGLYIVDCDNEEANARAGKLGITSPVRVRTRRGTHHYFMHPHDGRRRGPRVGSVGSADPNFPWPKVPNLDWRGDGAYALLPTEGGVYRWEVDPGFDVTEPPTWTREHDIRLGATDAKTFDPEQPAEQLDLSGVRTLSPDSHLSAWEKAEKDAAKFTSGRIPTGLGNGRNQRLVMHLSDALRMGLWGDALERSGRDFMARFFADPLPERGFKATLRWIMQAERRNSPERFDAAGNYTGGGIVDASLAKAFGQPPEQPSTEVEAPPVPGVIGSMPGTNGSPARLPWVYMRDAPELAREVAARGQLIGPFLPAGGTIVQVYGYTGHGKSTFVQHLLAAACAARPGQMWWGPFEIKRAPKVLYLNFEEGKHTIERRLREMEALYGSTGDNLAMWFPARTPELPASLRHEKLLTAIPSWIRYLRPDVVVIDTVRTAWPGLEEAKAEAWAPVNELSLKLRNAGIAVILLHHGNKPSEGNSVGVEAGSTAQLNNVETQIRVARVYASENDARLNAGLHGAKLNAEDFGYVAGHDVLDILQKDAGPDYFLEWALEARYRKLRDPTDEHDRAYMIGFARNLNDGSQKLVTSFSVKQRAQYMHAAGVPITEIARRTLRPASVLRGWLGV